MNLSCSACHETAVPISVIEHDGMCSTIHAGGDGVDVRFAG
jgi:hypothetical protein